MENSECSEKAENKKMRRMSEWMFSELSAVLGLLVGGILLVLSYLFDFYFNLKFCLGFIGLENACIRYAALLPFVLAIIFLIIAAIFKEKY